MKLIIKKYKALVLLAAMVAALAGCYKDKGDYDYTNINKVTIADTTATVYTVLQFDTLKVKPVVTQSLEKSNANLKYNWSIRAIDANNSTQQFPITQLSTDRELSARISIVPGKYKMTYAVTDTITNVSSYFFYEVNVGTSLSEGWMFLQQFSSNADISIVATTGKIFNNIYMGANGAALPRNANRIELTTVNAPKEVYIIATDSAYEVNPNSFGRIAGFNNWFFTPPKVSKPSVNMVYSPPTSTTRSGVLINNGLVHIKRYGGFPGSVLYGSELLLDNKLLYNMAPYVLPGDFNSARYMAVLYDTKNKQFVGLQGPSGGTTASLVHFPAPDASSAFDPNTIGMDLMYAGATGTNYIYNAILKDAAGDSYLFQLNLTLAQASKFKQKMVATDIASMSAAVSSRSLEYIYYAVGNKLYLYEIGPNASSELYTFPAGENVTSLTIDPNKSIFTLMAATYNGTAGKVYDFTLGVNGKIENNAPAKQYDGLGKVVYIKYKLP